MKKTGSDPFEGIASHERFGDESKSKEGGVGIGALFMSGLFSLCITAIIGFFLMLVAAFVAYSGKDPASMTTPLSLCALTLTSVMGGWIAAKRMGEMHLLSGLASGVIFAVAVFALSLCFSDDAARSLTLGVSGLVNFLLHVGIVIMECVGGALATVTGKGSERGEKRKRRKNAQAFFEE